MTKQLISPDGNLKLNFELLDNSTPSYSLTYKGKTVIKPSKMGLELVNDSKSLLNDFIVTDSTESSYN